MNKTGHVYIIMSFTVIFNHFRTYVTVNMFILSMISDDIKIKRRKPQGFCTIIEKYIYMQGTMIVYLEQNNERS